MNRREAERLTHQENVLMSLGFTAEEADKLRRISMTLRRWHELECGTDAGCIERDGEDGDGKPFMTYERSHSQTRGRYAIPDRETGAKKRLAAILKARNVRAWNPSEVPHGHLDKHPGLSAYIQTDPRGAALYIIRPGDVPEGSTVDSCYSRGICVY
jgi:hypothetical protein